MKPVRTYYRVVEKIDFHDGVVVRYNIRHDDLPSLECAKNWLKTYRAVNTGDISCTFFIEQISIYEPLQPELF